MFYKPLSEVDFNDLQLLVSNKVKEDTRLDYKLTLPDRNDKGRVEFLRDISAFANTNGGYLIYGIQEEEIDGNKTGVAEKIVGIEALNTNELQLWMENLIRTSIEPRLVGIEFKGIPISTSHAVLIVRVPRSWNLPHVISYGNHWRFYARNSAGNYQMDVTQLKDSFSLGNTITEKLEQKRSERLAIIKQKYQTGKMQPVSTLVIHIQPFDSLRPEYSIDTLKAKLDTKNLPLGYGIKCDPIFNFDGLIIKDKYNYLQIFNSGVTEEVNTKISSDENVINAKYLDLTIFKTVGWRMALLKSLNIESPLMIQVSLLGIGNHKIQSRYLFNQYFNDIVLPNLIDRPDLITKPIFVESLSNLILEGSNKQNGEEVINCWRTAEVIAKPALDSIWNAFGIERCLHYDENGKWQGFMTYADAIRFGADF